METCPSCGAQEIGFADKWASSVAYPARCPACSALSYVPRSATGGFVMLACLLLTASGFAAVFFQSGLLFGAGAIGASFVYIRGWRRLPLKPLGIHAAAQAKRADLVGTIAVLLAMLIK